MILSKKRSKAKEKSLSINLIIYFIRTLILCISPLVIFPYAARVVGAEGIGKVQYIQSYASYFQLLATFGITTYGVREGSKIRDNEEALDSLIRELTLMNVITTVISSIIYMVLMHYIVSDTYRTLVYIFLFYIIFYGMNFDWVFNVKERYGYITIRTFVGFVLSVIVVFLFVKTPSNYPLYAISIVLPFAVNFFANGWEVIRNIKIKYVKLSKLKSHFWPIFLIFSIAVSANIYSLLDSTILGLMEGDYAVGIYTAASKLCRFAVQLVTVAFTVFTPRLTYYIAKKKNELAMQTGTRMTNLCVFLILPLAIGMFVFSTQAILVFSGEQYLSGDITMKILCINMVFSAIDGFLGYQIMIPHGLESKLFLATIIGAVMDIILNILFIPKFHVEGVAFATLLSEFSVFFVCAKYSYKLVNMRNVILNTLKCLVGAAPILLTLLFWPVKDLSVFETLFVFVPVLALLYFVILYLLRQESIVEIANKARRIYQNMFSRRKI